MKGKMDKKMGMGNGTGKMPMMSENDMYGMMGTDMKNSNTKKAGGKKPASKKDNKKK